MRAVGGLAEIQGCIVRRPTSLLFVLLLVIGLAPAAFAAPADAPSRGGPPERETLIVTFDEGVAPAARAAGLARAFGGEVRYVYDRALDGAAIEVPANAAAGVARAAGVRRVEADQEMLRNDVVTQHDPVSWGLARIDQREALDPDSPEAWTYSYPQSAGSGVTVYVFDSGIRGSHEEFEGRLVDGFSPFRGRSSNPNQDCIGHGTHVAGTIGGSTYGVAKEVSLSSVRVFDCNGRGFASDLIAGIDWAVGNVGGLDGPAVANFSLGFPSGIVASVDQAVERLIDAGVVVAIAAGNDGLDACDFSPYSEDALTVSATDIEDARPSWANIGDCVDVFAPGVAIPSAWHTSNTQTVELSGTSMAAPHVAGVAALHLAEAPELLPEDVRRLIEDDATPSVVKDGLSSNDLLLYSSLGQSSGTTEPAANLGIEVTVSVEDDDLVEGEVASGTTVTVEAAVTNSGDLEASDTVVTLEVVRDDDRAVVASSTSDSLNVGPEGGEVVASMTWDTTGASPGTYTVVATADAEAHRGAPATASANLTLLGDEPSEAGGYDVVLDGEARTPGLLAP